MNKANLITALVVMWASSSAWADWDVGHVRCKGSVQTVSGDGKSLLEQTIDRTLALEARGVGVDGLTASLKRDATNLRGLYLSQETIPIQGTPYVAKLTTKFVAPAIDQEGLGVYMSLRAGSAPSTSVISVGGAFSPWIDASQKEISVTYEVFGPQTQEAQLKHPEITAVDDALTAQVFPKGAFYTALITCTLRRE